MADKKSASAKKKCIVTHDIDEAMLQFSIWECKTEPGTAGQVNY